MMGWLIALLAGTITGILSAFGIGGGSLLLIYLTSFAAIDQHQAQGINLLYFLPAAAAALPAHHKHGLLDKKVILPAILAGLAAAGLAAWLSSSLDTGLLRKLFGLFLLYVGLRELFHKDPDQSEKDDTKFRCDDINLLLWQNVGICKLLLMDSIFSDEKHADQHGNDLR